MKLRSGSLSLCVWVKERRRGETEENRTFRGNEKMWMNFPHLQGLMSAHFSFSALESCLATVHAGPTLPHVTDDIGFISKFCGL